MTGLEDDLSEETCMEKIKAVAGIYTNNGKEREDVIDKCSEFFTDEYSSMREKGKSEKIARNSSLMKTMEYMTEEVNKLYDSKRN